MTGSFASLFECLERRCLLSGAISIDGIGVLGDSYSDEYQFYSYGQPARNWVEQMAEDTDLYFGPFLPDPDGPAVDGPWDAGFQYNWAISGLTTWEMIDRGQHLGLAAQAAAGDVDLGVMFIGGMDFRYVFDVLRTEGPDRALQELQITVPRAITNIATAAGTVLGASQDVRMIIGTLPKLSYLPEIKRLLLAVPSLEPFVGAVDGAMMMLNTLIWGLRTGLPSGYGDRLATADFSSLVNRWYDAGQLRVGNVEMDLYSIWNPNNDPTHVTLSDGLHPGTVAQALMGNLFMKTANEAFGIELPVLSVRDILHNAGLWEQPRTRASAPPSTATASSPFASTGPTIGTWAMLSGDVDDVTSLRAA